MKKIAPHHAPAAPLLMLKLRRLLCCIVVANCGPVPTSEVAPPDVAPSFDAAVSDMRAQLVEAAGCDWPLAVDVRRALFALDDAGGSVIGRYIHGRIEVLPIVNGSHSIADSDRIVIGLPRDEFMRTLVHEFGHAAGLEHSSDPQNVMFHSGGVQPIAIDEAISQVSAALRTRCKWP